MKTTKKALAFLLAMVMCVASLAGCGVAVKENNMLLQATEEQIPEIPKSEMPKKQNAMRTDIPVIPTVRIAVSNWKAVIALMDNCSNYGSYPFSVLYTLFTVVASPRFDLFAAVRASAVYHELNTSAVSAVSAGLMAGLAIPDRIGVNIVFRAFTWRVASLSPFIHRIEARATVGAAVFATFLL